MAKEKLIRPDSEKTKTMIARAEFLDMRLGAIAGAEESLHTAVRGAASALFEDRVQKALTAMEVEHLNKARQGIRVGLLRDAGIETVWQASRLSFRELSGTRAMALFDDLVCVSGASAFACRRRRCAEFG